MYSERESNPHATRALPLKDSVSTSSTIGAFGAGAIHRAFKGFPHPKLLLFPLGLSVHLPVSIRFISITITTSVWCTNLTTQCHFSFHLLYFRGWDRIRTCVDGFADHCLATRPPSHYFWSSHLDSN